MIEHQASEIYVKKVELSDGRKAVIKSKWNVNVVEIQIFIQESSSIFVGVCSQESLRNKKTINVKYEAIKESLTSDEEQAHISYELNKLKFAVKAQASNSDDDSFEELIYLKTDVTKLKEGEVIPLTFQLIEEMSDALMFKSALKKYKNDMKEMENRYESLMEKKSPSDSALLKILEIVNQKKQRIAKLEKQFERKNNHSNKFLNLSSDMDLSSADVTMREEPREEPKVITPKKSITILQSSEEIIGEPKASTSSHKSPARKKPGSKNNSPSTRFSQRRTPRKLTPSKELFKFQKHKDSSDDDLDLAKLMSPRKGSKSVPENLFAGINVKIPIKKVDDSSERESSVERKTPKKIKVTETTTRRSREKSEVPDDMMELGQQFSFKNELRSSSNSSTDIEKASKKLQSSEDLFKSDDDFKSLKDEDEVVENSQPEINSPSIFQSYSKRKPQEQAASSKQSKKSKFSENTQNILNESFSP